MTETPQSRAESATVTREPRAVESPPRYDRYDRPSRLNQALAWVGIVVGVVFVVAVIFFAGFFIGTHSGVNYGGHHGYRGGQMGPMGPGQMGPGGMMGPDGMMGPGQQQSPTTTALSPPRP